MNCGMRAYCATGVRFILEELPERELVIAYNEQMPLSKAVQEFLSYFAP